MNPSATLIAVAAVIACASSASAQDASSSISARLVTVDNFNRAESDFNMGNLVKAGLFGKLFHYRELKPLDEQKIVRPNRDTLYSEGIFDLDAGPVTITLPDAGDRFMSMQLVSEDNYVPAVFYGAGTHEVTSESVGTRYVLVLIRTLINPDNPADLGAVQALQDAIAVEQPGGPGVFEVPNWDEAGLKKVREALLVLGTTIPNTHLMFGKPGEVDPVRHLIGTALGWGGNPEQDAVYLNFNPPGNDGTTVHKLTVPAEVPVDGFWSISLYNAEGFFQENDLDAYSLNSETAKRNADGSVDVQFGGCDGNIPNCLPIMPGWNYTVRLYRARAEILDGSWTFPEAEPLG